MESCPIPLCNYVERNGYEALVLHLQQFHANFPNLSLRCNRPGCPQTFSKFTSRRAHISKNHREQGRGQHLVENNADADVLVLEANPDHAVEQEEVMDVLQDPDELKKECEARFLLRLRSRVVPEPIVQCVIENSEELVQSCLKSFQVNVQRALLDHGINLNDYLDVEETLRNSGRVFTDLKSKWKRDLYFKENNGVIESRRRDLERRVIRGPQVNLQANRMDNLNAEKYYYVSILDVLSKLLSHPDYDKITQRNDVLEDNFHRFYLDCPNFLSHELFKEKPNALQIMLYYDDVNLVDTASTRPVGMSYFYFSLANIHPRYRSRLDFIHLVLACEGDYFKNSANEVMEPLVCDLKKLEGGVCINGTDIYGAVVAFLGDNKAQHIVGGFKEGFTATHPCRYCMASLDEVRRMTREDVGLLRTPQQYDDQAEQLEDAGEEGNNRLYKDLSESFGINRRSILNSLQYFHVVGGLMPDLFHDHLHLQFGLQIQLLLRHFLIGASKVMTLVDFNDALMEYDFGYQDTKPSKVLEGHLRPDASVHQTGAQIWNLAWTLPFILGPFINHMDEFWWNYLELLEISRIIMGHEFSVAMVENLQFLIDRYLTNFLKLYPDHHLLPRQHYLLHVPKQMLHYGPLYQFITWHYEGKHQYFKALFKKLKCFKNPALTSAREHEVKQANFFSGSLIKNENQGPVKFKSRLEFTYSHLLPENIAVFPTVPWVEIFGVNYKSNKCYLLLNVKNGSPIFGFLKEIMYINASPVFVCSLASTVCKDVHLSSYEIEPTEELKLVQSDELYHYPVYFSHVVDNKYYIPMKRSIGDLL